MWPYVLQTSKVFFKFAFSLKPELQVFLYFQFFEMKARGTS